MKTIKQLDNFLAKVAVTGENAKLDILVSDFYPNGMAIATKWQKRKVTINQ